MKIRSLVMALVMIGAPAHADTITDGDKAFQAHDYQKAENLYVDAFYTGKNQDAVLLKLQTLYKASNLRSLDTTINEKLKHLVAPHKAVADLYPVVNGPLSDYLLSREKEQVTARAEKIGMSINGWSGYVCKLLDRPAVAYQVVAYFKVDNEDASLISVYDANRGVVNRSVFFPGEAQQKKAVITPITPSFAQQIADDRKKQAAIDAELARKRSEDQDRLDARERQQALDRQREAVTNNRPGYFARY